MQRQAIDNSRNWFNTDAATEYAQDTYWNGSNMISKATGSQWNHEKLYRTKNGKWVLNHWSQMQGSGETWEEIDDEAAAVWLIKNGHDPIGTAAEEQAAALEI